MSCCATLGRKFDAAYVAEELARRRKSGPGKTASRMAEAVAAVAEERGGLAGTSALDVGAGLGDVLAALLERGVREGTHVEASTAYSRAARELAREAGHEGRIRFVVGDLVALTGNRTPSPGPREDGGGVTDPADGTTALPEAEIVTLDRVICCYPDMPALLEASAARACHLYALSAPRDRWPVRLALGVENFVRRLRKDPFRTYVHSWQEMERRLRRLGFERVRSGGTLVWRLAVYRRVG